MLHFQDLLKLLGSVNEMKYQPEFKALPGGEDLIILPKIVLENMSTNEQLSYKLCNPEKMAVFHQISEK